MFRLLSKAPTPIVELLAETLCMLCSAFYERMKEVREYHRRYPYLEVAEVSCRSLLGCY